MKRIAILLITVAMVVALVFGVSTAMAAKGGQGNGGGTKSDNANDLIVLNNNGFPSGLHWNLNIHGKKDGFNCDSMTAGGASVFVPEYGDATINYVTNNKKDPAGNLTALDPCAFDDGNVTVQVPYNEWGFDVYARILGKPNHGQTQLESNIMLHPTQVVEACGNVSGTETSCSEVQTPIGVIVHSNVYVPSPDPAVFVRFATQTAPKKGKSTAVDITPLFEFSGFAVDEILDWDGDGVLTDSDVPGQGSCPGNATLIVETKYSSAKVDEYDNDPNWGDGSGLIDTIGEWLLFNCDLYEEDNTNPYCVLFEYEWILNIAELVVAGQNVENDGTKLLQVRFYPRFPE